MVIKHISRETPHITNIFKDFPKNKTTTTKCQASNIIKFVIEGYALISSSELVRLTT